MGLRFKRARRGIRAIVAESGLADVKTHLMLPTTSMNVSGQAVAPFVRRVGAELHELLVVHDDIDLPFGKIRVQFGRGAGGHNGVISVQGSLRSQDFWRLKIGVGRPPAGQDPADFVLRRFSRAEASGVETMMSRALDVLDTYIAQGPAAARQRTGEEDGPQ